MAILGRGAAVGVARMLADALLEIYMSRYILHGGCSNAKQSQGSIHHLAGRARRPVVWCWCLSSGVARQNTRLDLKLPSVAEGGR